MAKYNYDENYSRGGSRTKYWVLIALLAVVLVCVIVVAIMLPTWQDPQMNVPSQPTQATTPSPVQLPQRLLSQPLPRSPPRPRSLPRPLRL